MEPNKKSSNSLFQFNMETVAAFPDKELDQGLAEVEMAPAPEKKQGNGDTPKHTGRRASKKALCEMERKRQEEQREQEEMAIKARREHEVALIKAKGPEYEIVVSNCNMAFFDKSINQEVLKNYLQNFLRATNEVSLDLGRKEDKTTQS